jgi:beta-galactosidase
VQVTTPVVDKSRSVARVEVQATNSGAPTETSVRMTVLDSRGRPVATQTTDPRAVDTGATETYAAELAISDAALWSPEDPNLYQVRTEILVDGRVVDAVTTRFGIRSLVFNGTVGFLLNGKPYKVRGGNIHHDHGPLGSVAIDRAEERTIEILKAAGFNAIRASHNPRSPSMLDACDRLGMLVYNEFTDMWDIGKMADDYHLYFPDWWERDLTSMVLRDRNHPSVFIWSLGNEISADPNNYGPRLAALVRSLDATRPITLGGAFFGQPSYVDLGDVHYQTDTTALHAAHPDKAICRGEDYPKDLYDYWKFDQDHAWMVGSWVWSGWDYIGESAIGAPAAAATEAQANALGIGAAAGQVPYPWCVSFSGDLDLIGQRKPQNYWRAVVNGFSPLGVMVERPTPPGTQQFPVWFSYYDELPNWTWAVPQGQTMTVHVYTSGDSVTLRLNGKPVATKTLTDGDKRVATFSVPYTPGELTASASLNGREIASKTLTTTGAPAAIRLSSDVKWLTTDRGDLAHVLAEVVDSHGRVVPDAVVKINFQVGGAGELIGVGNGNPHNVDSFQRPRHYTWHGQALAILRPAKWPGGLVLTATAAGLQPGTLTLGVAPGRDSR